MMRSPRWSVKIECPFENDRRNALLIHTEAEFGCGSCRGVRRLNEKKSPHGLGLTVVSNGIRS